MSTEQRRWFALTRSPTYSRPVGLALYAEGQRPPEITADRGAGMSPEQLPRPHDPSDLNQLMTVREVAEFTGFPIVRIRRWCRERPLDRRLMGGRFYIPRKVAERWRDDE